MKKGIILAVTVMIIIAVALIFSPKAEVISLYDAILRDIEDFYGIPTENIRWTGAIFPFESNIEKDFDEKSAETGITHDFIVSFVNPLMSDIVVIHKDNGSDGMKGIDPAYLTLTLQCGFESKGENNVTRNEILDVTLYKMLDDEVWISYSPSYSQAENVVYDFAK